MNDLFQYLWIAWLGLFLAIEGVALANKAPGDTLSEHVRKWFHTAKGQKVDGTTKVRRLVLLSFMAWLSVHFLTGGWI